MIIREMSSKLDFEHIESVANQSGCGWLMLEYARGVLVPQHRDMESIKLLSRWQQEIGSSFRTGEAISAYEIFLWALTALEFEESVSATERSTSGHFLPGVERTFEQICDDRVVGVSVSSSGLLEFDSNVDLGDSQTEFEIQCVWISSLFQLGAKRPKWSFLQQLALSSFLDEYFPNGMSDSPGSSEDAYEFDPEHVFSLGHYSCLLLPFEMAEKLEITESWLWRKRKIEFLETPRLR